MMVTSASNVEKTLSVTIMSICPEGGRNSGEGGVSSDSKISFEMGRFAEQTKEDTH